MPGAFAGILCPADFIFADGILFETQSSKDPPWPSGPDGIMRCLYQWFITQKTSLPVCFDKNRLIW